MKAAEGEFGFISSISNGSALVRLVESDSCSQCKAKILCRPNTKGIREITVFNKIQAQVGDKVRVVETGNLLLLLSFFQFAVPLLGLLGGIFLAYGLQVSFLMFPDELTMALSGLLGLIIGGFVAWLWAKNKSKTTSYIFEIASVYPAHL